MSALVCKLRILFFADPVAMEIDNEKLPKLLMYRDSYTNALVPLISEHFQKSIYLWTYHMDPKTIEKIQPDIVVLEILERFLDPHNLSNSEELTKN